MSFWKDPQYSSMRVLIIIVLVIVAGYFAYKYENTSGKTTGLVLNTGTSIVHGAPFVPLVPPVVRTNLPYVSTGATTSPWDVIFSGSVTSVGTGSLAYIGFQFKNLTSSTYDHGWHAAVTPSSPLPFSGEFSNIDYDNQISIACSTSASQIWDVRAYAMSTAGIAYGTVKTVTVPSCPVGYGADHTKYLDSSVEFSGDGNDDGGTVP